MSETSKPIVKQKHPKTKCAQCPLGKYQTFVPPEDTGVIPQVVCISTAPGTDELAQRRPFVGKSGTLLRRTIGEDVPVHYTNLALCYIPEDMREDEMTMERIFDCCWKPRVDDEVWNNTAEDVILLGGNATKAFGYTQNITSIRGQMHNIKGKRVHISLDPAYVVRQSHLLETFQNDIRRAVHRNTESNPLEVEYSTVVDPPNVRDLLHVLGNHVAFDTETSGRWYDSDFRVLMLQLYDGGDTVYVFSETYLKKPGVADALCDLFDSPRVWIAHNGKYDILALRSVGIWARCTFDTMLAHYNLHESGVRHSLKAVASSIWGIEDWQKPMLEQYNVKSDDDSVETDRAFAKIPFDVLCEYCTKDVLVTYALYDVLSDRMDTEKLVSRKPFDVLLMPALKLTTEMEYRGIRVDTKWLAEVEDHFKHRVYVLREKLRDIAGEPALNPNSTSQVSYVLYKDLGLPTPEDLGMWRVPKNSTKDDVLEKLVKHDRSGFVDILREYRHWSKLQSTYIEGIREYLAHDGRVHPTFRLHGTETGRLSSAQPNFQNIPSPKSSDDLAGILIRSLFIPTDGQLFVEADYSQNEIRVGAALSNDQFLIGVYETDGDLHTEVAKRIYHTDKPTKEQRFLAKKFNFGGMYGANAQVIAEQAHMPIEDVEPAYNEFRKLWSGYYEWAENQKKFVAKYGYVTTPFGRYRRWPIIPVQGTPEYNEMLKAAVNMPVQSTGSDLLLASAIHLFYEGYNIVNLVHDSILLECPAEDAQRIANIVVEVMCSVGTTYLHQVKWKADAEVKDRWYSKPTEEQINALYK